MDDVWIELENLWDLYHQDALDKSLLSAFCMMKVQECRKNGIDPHVVNEESWSLLKDDNDDDDYFRVRCDVAILREAAPQAPPRLGLGDLLAGQRAGRDVTFEVGGEVFTAHRCVLAARSTVFMAELFGPGGQQQQNDAAASRVRIDGMAARVFQALLHFIYTDSFPKVDDDGDKVAMAQGLLAAADRYKLEGLKSACSDMLGSRIDATTVVTTLQLAHKHGCHNLKEACTKFLKDVPGEVGRSLMSSS
ncbi:BTB/POZ and MATH domain-containing protein 2-like [Panicum virgatum]|uniref:BTB/POZ and MATH domain-containing protein 2-like n=1 Tax=Panicum virgatum TaxID=38727 RepID=UPI0019D52932|nr:BTB/POZ and MATH domain-containing protein 2-like [Panicum virgatum]